ncbi:MAG: PAS domain S-box protein [Acidimicrobiia bacterium]
MSNNADKGSHVSGEEVLAPYADSPVGAALHRDGVILGVNQAFADMYGVADPADVSGMKIFDFVAPEARARVAQIVAAPTDEPILYDCLRLDGVPLMVSGQGHTVVVDGIPARVTLLTPLTDLGTPDRLHESSELFRMAFEHAAIGKALVSPEGRILHVNPALAELLGRPSAELLGQLYDSMSHPDDREIGVLQAISLLLGEGDTYEIEKRYTHADGHVIWVAIVVALVRTREGTPRYFIAQVQDVTERRQAQDALHRETERLRLMQAVAEAANSTEEPDAAYTTALAAVCAHTGWPLAHVYRRMPVDDVLEPSELWHFHDRDADFTALVTATAHTILGAGEGLVGVAVVERRPTWFPVGDLVARRGPQARAAGVRSAVALPVFADGEIVAVLEFFSYDADPLDDALLELLGHVGTQIGRVAERSRAREQAHALDEARSRFVANAAHELRTPLATLRTIAGLLGSRRAEMSEADIAECCELLERQGANLDALVDDLLDLSRLQQGGRPEALRSGAGAAGVDRARRVGCRPTASPWSVRSTPACT